MASGENRGEHTPPPKRKYDEIDPKSPEYRTVLKELLEEYLDPIKKDISDLKSSLKTSSDLQTKYETVTTESSDLKERLVALEDLVAIQTGKIAGLNLAFEEQQTRLVQLEKENKQLHNDMLYSECYSRRDNLHFNGIPEDKFEDVEAKVVQICTDAGLNITRNSFVRVQRVGGYQRGRTRPVEARFHHFKDREMVWLSRKGIRSMQYIGITEDFPPEILERRNSCLLF